MYQKILVPPDGSESARHALVAALELAKKFNSEVELFHVTLSQAAYYGYYEGYLININKDQLNTNGALALEFTLKGIDVGEVHLSKRHVSGNAAECILEEIKKDFDLVIMGTRGHGGLAGVIVGSVAQRVLAKSDCPVMIVK